MKKSIKPSLLIISALFISLPSAAHNQAFDQWQSACNKLPAYDSYNQSNATAISWHAFDATLEQFFNSNTTWYKQKENSWINGSPSAVDDFYDTQKTIFKPFVQKLVVPQGATIALHGDLHGDVHSLLAYIKFLQNAGYLQGFNIIAPDFYIIFLGDYVDRGAYGIETLYTLMQLKIANPDHVFLVRGNHEDSAICSQYGFLQECIKKWGTECNYQKVMRLYDFLPAALYLGSSSGTQVNYMLCCHGGLEIGFDPHPLLASPHPIAFSCITSLDQYTNALLLPLSLQPNWLSYFKNFIPHSFTQIGFLWNDFDALNMHECQKSYGRGFCFGKKFTRAVLESQSNHSYTVQGVLRAHQHSGSMMDAILDPSTDHQGVAKLWKDSEIQQSFDLWPGIVCTFLVSPCTPYSQHGKLYDYDSFALLKTSANFNDWQMKVYRNPLSIITQGLPYH